MPLVQPHNTTHNPVGLWQFNGNLNDSSGNGFTLTVETGEISYAQILPGLVGVNLAPLASTTRLVHSTFQSALAITGDLTIECVLLLTAYTTTLRWLVSHDNNSDAEADNTLYAVDLMSELPNPGRLKFFTENGAGIDSSYEILDKPPLGPCHFAVTRASNVIQFYLNGRTLGAASSPLVTPTGGANGRFRVGGNPMNSPPAIVSSLKICNTALSAAQIANEYNRTLGTFYGIYQP